MADQTHMQCGSKERHGLKQSSGAGRAVGLQEGAVRQAWGWSHSSSHSLFVTEGRESQLSSPDRNTHTHFPPCALITQAQWTHKNRIITTKNTTNLIKAACTQWRREWIRQKAKQRKHTAWQTEKDPMRRTRGTGVLSYSPRIFTACQWKQLEVIKMEVKWQGECGFPPPPLSPTSCLLDGGVSACRAQGANQFTSHSRQH